MNADYYDCSYVEELINTEIRVNVIVSKEGVLKTCWFINKDGSETLEKASFIPLTSASSVSMNTYLIEGRRQYRLHVTSPHMPVMSIDELSKDYAYKVFSACLALILK